MENIHVQHKRGKISFVFPKEGTRKQEKNENENTYEIG